MTYRALILFLVCGVTSSSHAFATSIGGPVHCIPPKEAIDQCIPGIAELRLVVGADSKLVSSSVASTKPSPLFDKWAQCLAEKIEVKMLIGTAKRLGPGAHIFPVSFDPGKCASTRPNNSFKPSPHQGGA